MTKPDSLKGEEGGVKEEKIAGPRGGKTPACPRRKASVVLLRGKKKNAIRDAPRGAGWSQREKYQRPHAVGKTYFGREKKVKRRIINSFLREGLRRGGSKGRGS